MQDSGTDPRLASIQRLLDEGRHAEARVSAEATLAALSASADPLLIGSLQLAIVQAGLGSGPPDAELGRTCRAAMENLRQTEREADVRLCILQLGLDLPDCGDAARDARVWLTERRPKLQPPQLVRLIMFEALMARRERVDPCEIMRRGIDQLGRGPEQLELRIVLARMELGLGRAVENLDELVREGVAASAPFRLAGMVESLAWDHHDRLQPATVRHVIDWARDRAPQVSGYLLAQLGATDEAIELLRTNARASSDFVRSRCLHALLPLLPNDPERLRCAEELEALLDRDDDPATRHDLALSMALLARTSRDVGLMERALANARRAATGLPRIGSELVLELLGELIQLRSTRPTAALAELARELLGAMPDIAAERLAEVRAIVAAAMTLMGPLCHPQVLVMAERLANLAVAANHEQTMPRLVQARCRWLHDRQRGVRTESGAWQKAPFDDAPQWLIDLTGGTDVRVAPDELRTGHELLRRAVGARPDAADHLLSNLIPVWEAASGDWVAAFEATLWDCVEIAPHAGEGAWPKLHAAVEDALGRNSRAWLQALFTTISRARGEVLTAPFGATGVPNSAGEHVHLLFSRARQASERVRDFPQPGRAEDSELARTLWREAFDAAEATGDTFMAFHARVGLGNALRWGEEPNIEAALTCYCAAAALGVDDEQALAKLWKVWGDALVERGSEQDLRQAEELIGRSLEVRTGRYRAETLLSASMVAERHPDLDVEARLRRSIQYLMGAVRADDDIGEAVVPDLCERLAALRRVAPGHQGVDEQLRELERRHPKHRLHIERARHGVGDQLEDGVADSVMHAMSDADVHIVMELRAKLTDPDEQIAQMPPHIFAQIPREDMRKRLLDDCVLGDPKRLEAELARLRSGTPREGSLGRLVGELLVLAQLVRLALRDEAEARRATTAARLALQHSSNPQARVLLSILLAEAWQGLDTSNTGPMSDIDLSRELASEAVEAAGGEARAPSDLVVLLARGHRYARTGDRNEHLRRAREIYAGLHERARAAGDGDMAAIALNHQVDAEMEMAVGDRAERLRAGIEKLHFALGLARAPRRLAEIQVSIAWFMTKLADFVGGDEQRTLLEQALERFEAVDRNAVPAAANLDHLRKVCEGSLARIRRGPEAEAELLEAQLDDPSLTPYDRAVTQHNLAIRLRRLPHVSSTHLLRALILFDAAARVREPVSARHAWETCFEAGLMVVEALQSSRGLTPDLLPWERPVAVIQARDWLERALAAAEQLGPGEELADAAAALAALAGEAQTFASVAEIGERAWIAFRRATPYLLLNEAQRAREASLARALVVRLATLGADDGVVGVGKGGVRALAAASSELVVRWLLRSQASARRLSIARIQRPELASAAWWSRWQAALDHRNHATLNELLEQLHADEPNYLTGDPTLDATWAWLEAEPGAVAIAVVLGPRAAVCVVLHLDACRTQRTRVLVVPGNAPPGSEDQLVDLVKDMILGDPKGLAVHATMVEWARSSIVEPVLAHLGTVAKTVLWCPGPILRLVTPSSIWPGVPVACVHSLALPRYRLTKQRPRSSLIAAAMPKGDSMAGKMASPLQGMLAEAKRHGPARALVSAGEVYGHRLPKLRPIRDTPASPSDLLAEAPNHDLIVLLAHGRAGTEELAALACVGADGSMALLTGRDLAAARDAFAGAMVVLLACSSGRIGGELHTPDGIAGALLAAGARAVIAPLWSVQLPIANQAARALLRGFAKDRSPWQVLAELPATILTGGPTLDEPTDEQRCAGRSLQRQSFVVWLG